MRLTIPVATVAGYATLLALGGFTVASALVVAGGALGSTVAAAGLCLVRHGISSPSRALMRKTVSYGVQAHGGDLAGFVSARLDLLIIPAFLPAASVGYYSVATNVASIIGTLTGSIAVIALPVAARDLHTSSRTVLRHSTQP